MADTYMRLWLRMEDVLSVAFLVPKENPRRTQLAGFHLSLPMEYVDNVPYFYMATDTVANLVNKAISQMEQVRKHPLEMAAEARAADNSGAPEAQSDASWDRLPAEQRSATTANADVYLDDFISVVQ